MLCSSTHDTKRSEDVRARVSVLSEIPGLWSDALDRWSAINEPRKLEASGVVAPDRNDEYLLYQTIVGAWPMEWTALDAPPPFEGDAWKAFRERVVAYMNKATKEAKTHTSWVNPNEAYDHAVRQFVERALEGDAEDSFLADLHAFVCRVAHFGRFNALSALTLKLTVPGVPDLYQGNEMWDLSLVDPDNRRPVDFEGRKRALSGLRSRLAVQHERPALLNEVLDSAIDGRVKLLVVHTLLSHRREHADLYTHGDYQALKAAGLRADHVVAFLRSHGDEQLLVVVPRLVHGLVDGEPRAPMGMEPWRDTAIRIPKSDAGAAYRCLFSLETFEPQERDGELVLSVGTLTTRFPVVVLERVRSE